MATSSGLAVTAFAPDIKRTGLFQTGQAFDIADIITHAPRDAM